MKQLSKDLQEFIHLLEAHSVEYLIVGAWALAFHGRPRYTGDLDIFIKPDPSNAQRIDQVVNDFGFGNTGLGLEDFLKKDYVIQLGVAPNRIDLLTGISGVTFDEAWQARVKGKFAGGEAWFISREHLILNKKASNRDKDAGDVRLLESFPPQQSDKQ